MNGDPIWQDIRKEVERAATVERLLNGFLDTSVLSHPTLERSLALIVTNPLACETVDAATLRELAVAALEADPSIGEAVRADLGCRMQRDPACTSYATAFLYLKGFHALQAYRVAHWLWGQGRQHLALFLQSRISAVFGVDIHPAARIGSGVMFDHATGIVIGETAEVGDDVSILHEVTLGGTGKQAGDRHPKVRSGVMIGAGAKLLGNIVVGQGAKIGAGSVVLKDVRPHCTVAGVPAEVVGRPRVAQPALEMDQSLSNGDRNTGSGEDT